MNILFKNCLKSPRKKKFFSSIFSVFFGFWSFLTVFLPPLPEVRCPIFLEIRNPWGKIMERSGHRYEHFCLKIVWNRRAKKVFFFTFFGLFRFLVFFNSLFAPISRSRMSNIFRDSESLGKSNGKKWFQIWTFLFENCLKSPRKKKVFFLIFFSLLRFLVFFNSLFAPTFWSRMSNIFRDSESLGKSNGKKGSNIWTFLFGSGLKSPRKKKFFFVADFSLVHPPMASVLLSASVERCFVSHMRDFSLRYLL